MDSRYHKRFKNTLSKTKNENFRTIKYRFRKIELNHIYSDIFSFVINNNIKENGIWLIDGNIHPPINFNIENIIKGDSKSILIGIASIIAKEFRYNQMKKLDKEYPIYNFVSHKGYGTKSHYEAIKKMG